MTVFLIGMRANRWWQLPKVLRVASAMPRMLRHLAAHPDAGMLGWQQWLGRTTLMVSYWRSPEHLQKFASDRDAPTWARGATSRARWPAAARSGCGTRPTTWRSPTARPCTPTCPRSA